MTQYGGRRITEGFQTDRFVDMVQPYSEFELPYLLKGWKEQDILASFAKIVDENKSKCIFERGQWLVPRFMGVEKTSGVPQR